MACRKAHASSSRTKSTHRRMHETVDRLLQEVLEITASQLVGLALCENRLCQVLDFGIAVDDEALQLLDLIAARYAGDISGVTVAKGVTISNGAVFLTASRTALSSSSSAQRSTAAANIYGAAAALRVSCGTG